MITYADRIKPDDGSISIYLESLKKKNYQIPTFQRNIVWGEENVKKLWDSIYKFYPIGSILIWETDIKLQNHRAISGHEITDGSARTEYKYILDGQQRTNSLLTSIYGGTIKGKGDFDPTLYIDITISSEEETDDESYKKRFLFWDEIDDRNGEIRQNIGKKNRYDEGLIMKIRDVKENFSVIEKKLVEQGYADYDHPYRVQLRKIKEVLDNYKIAFIVLRGIQLPAVCQIFERVNVEGKQLDIFDIVVAKTFRPGDENVEVFYLRDLINDFRDKTQGNFSKIDDLTYLQILSIFINQKKPDSGIHNITPPYLSKIKTEDIEEVWAEVEEKKVLLKLFDFFENHLHLKGPELIPFRYFYMTLASYFFDNSNPDYDFLKKYFWFYSFHNDELLRNTTHLWNHIKFLNKGKKGELTQFDRFLIDKNNLRTSSYSSKGRLSRAILSLYSNQEPKDWKYPDRSVITDVYYLLTDKPNLHHIFPTNYIATNPGKNELNSNSLMNIAYLTQIANLEISDKNPIKYLKNYDNSSFVNVMKSHLLPEELIKWSRIDSMPENGLDLFIEKRIDFIIEKLKEKLIGINFEIIDTKEQKEYNQKNDIEEKRSIRKQRSEIDDIHEAAVRGGKKYFWK